MGGSLLFVDMLAGDVLRLAGDAGVSRHSIGTVAAVLRARTRGGFVAAVERAPCCWIPASVRSARRWASSTTQAPA